MRERPFFCFDRGHVAVALPDVFAAGVRAYYGGLAPALRRLQDPFDPAALEAQAGRERPAWAAARSRIRAAEPLEALLAAVPPPHPTARTPHG
jgi:hypothetical protein